MLETLDWKQKEAKQKRSRAASRRYQARHPERIREFSRRYYLQHTEERKANARNGHLKKYNLTKADYALLLESQNGVCAICLRVCSSGRRLAVDHDHVNGKVRGLLCSNCNTGLGKLETLLGEAAAYLLQRGNATC